MAPMNNDCTQDREAKSLVGVGGTQELDYFPWRHPLL